MLINPDDRLDSSQDNMELTSGATTEYTIPTSESGVPSVGEFSITPGVISKDAISPNKEVKITPPTQTSTSPDLPFTDVTDTRELIDTSGKVIKALGPKKVKTWRDAFAALQSKNAA